MCSNCGGSTGWVLVDEENWKQHKGELDRCEDCGARAYCSCCAPYGELHVHRSEYNDTPRPYPGPGQRIKSVRKTFCG